MSDPELEKILSSKMKKMVEVSERPNSIVRLTGSNFYQYAKSDKPLFVDFWAEWCGPCRMMEPVVDRLARKFAGRLTVGKLNVDEESSLATKYDVLSIPTFMVFKKGNPVDAVIGAVGELVLDKFIQKAISGQSQS